MQFEPVDIGIRADGLANAKTTALVQSIYDGSFWIATSGSGVSRYDMDAKLWQTFTEVDGLADADVRCIVQTAAGDLWFGTTGGASHYSPSSRQWQSFSTANGLANNKVWALAADQHSRIWLGTSGGGVSCYTPTTGEWRTYTVANGLASDKILALLVDTAGNIWVGTESGLTLLNPETGNHKSFYTQDGLADDHVRSLAEDDKGNIWIGTFAGLNRYRPDTGDWHTFGIADGLGSNYVQALAYRTDGSLWAGTLGGISVYDTDTNRWHTLTQQDGLSDNEVWGLLEDNAARLWVATWGGGVSIYDLESKGWTIYTTPPEFSDSYALSVIKSDEAHVWIGTYGAVSRYATDSGAWETLSSADGLPNNFVQTLAQDNDDNLWIGTGAGLICYQPQSKQWTTYRQPDGVEPGLVNDKVRVLLFAVDSGELWIGTARGLCNYRPDSGQWQVFSEAGLSTADVRSLALDGQGDLWIGTTNGLVVRNAGNTWQHFSVDDGLLNPKVNALAADATGCIWIGTEGGLNAYTPATGQWRSYTSAQGLVNNQVRALIYSDGSLWIACAQGGLNRYQPNSDTWQSLDGLGSDNLTSLALDGASRLWISSAGGGVTSLFRHGPEAGYVQHFAAGETLFANQLWAFPGGAALGRPTAIAVNHLGLPATEAQVDRVVHTPRFSGARVDGRTLLWAASDEKGLSLIVVDNNKRTTATNLPSRHLTAVNVASNGDAWVGTAAGTAMVSQDKLSVTHTLQYPDTPCGPVDAVAAVSNREVYIGLNARNPILFADEQAAKTRATTSVWLCTSDGNVKQLPTASNAAAFGRSTIHNMVWNSSSGLWIATSVGLFHCTKDQSELTYIDTPGVAGHSITQVTVAPDGNAFALVAANAKNDQAVVMVRAATGQSVQWPLPTTVFSIDVASDGRLWASSGRYLYATPEAVSVV